MGWWATKRNSQAMDAYATRRHDGADHERADGHVFLDGILELEQAGADQRRDRQEERQPGRRDPVEPAQQAGADRRA